MIESEIFRVHLDVQFHNTFCGFLLLLLFCIFHRSEQDKEPEQEQVSENVGPGASEEQADNGMLWTLK